MSHHWVGPVPELQWLEAEESGWGVRLLDLRKSAVETMAMTSEQTVAETFLRLQQDDGQWLREVEMRGPAVACQLRYPLDRPLGDGILFSADAMEDKWALYHYDSRLFCLRSWTGSVEAVARTRQENGFLVVSEIQGSLGLPDSMLARTLDFLILSHPLGLPYPAPLEPSPDQDTPMRYFGLFGRRAQCASESSPVVEDCPPLRSISLLHLASVRDEPELAARCLSEGFSLASWATDGRTPLQWAVIGGHARMVEQLLRAGSPVDDVADDGSTALMTAVENENRLLLELLIAHGAGARLADHRGFTSLHRAAEMSQVEAVRVLLQAGADPGAVDKEKGLRPFDLASSQEIRDLLR